MVWWWIVFCIGGRRRRWRVCNGVCEGWRERWVGVCGSWCIGDEVSSGGVIIGESIVWFLWNVCEWELVEGISLIFDVGVFL